MTQDELKNIHFVMHKLVERANKKHGRHHSLLASNNKQFPIEVSYGMIPILTTKDGALNTEVLKRGIKSIESLAKKCNAAVQFCSQTLIDDKSNMLDYTQFILAYEMIRTKPNQHNEYDRPTDSGRDS